MSTEIKAGDIWASDPNDRFTWRWVAAVDDKHVMYYLGLRCQYDRTLEDFKRVFPHRVFPLIDNLDEIAAELQGARKPYEFESWAMQHGPVLMRALGVWPQIK